MSEVNEKPVQLDVNQQVVDAFEQADIPKIYANSFIVTTGVSDFAVVLLLNGKPIQLLNLSYTSMKSLVEVMETQIDKFESKTGTKLLTSKEVTEKIFPDKKQ